MDIDVAEAAYQAADTPPWPRPSELGHGRCARCDTSGWTVAATAAISDHWFGFDAWRTASRPRLCIVCAWLYATADLRRHSHIITAAPTLQQAGPSQLYSLLSQPLPADTAVAVILRPGRKHVLPNAKWGRIAADDTCISWSTSDTGRLATMKRLRRLGFGSHQLAAPAPAHTVLTKLEPAQQLEALDAWQALDTWRTRQPWLQIAIRATMPEPAAA